MYECTVQQCTTQVQCTEMYSLDLWSESFSLFLFLIPKTCSWSDEFQKNLPPAARGGAPPPGTPPLAAAGMTLASLAHLWLHPTCLRPASQVVGHVFQISNFILYFYRRLLVTLPVDNNVGDRKRCMF